MEGETEAQEGERSAPRDSETGAQVPKKEPKAKFLYVGGMGQGQERAEMKPIDPPDAMTQNRLSQTHSSAAIESRALATSWSAQELG